MKGAMLIFAAWTFLPLSLLGNLIPNGQSEHGPGQWRMDIPREAGSDGFVGVPDTGEAPRGATPVKFVKTTELLTNIRCPQFRLKEETAYRLRVVYKTANASKAPPLRVRLSVATPSKALTKNYLWITLPAAEEWTTKESTYATPREVTTGYVTVFFEGTGTFWLSEVTLDERDAEDGVPAGKAATGTRKGTRK